MARFPTAFTERNTVLIAVVGLLTLGLVTYGTFNAAALPIIGGGTTHVAQFAEAGGLRPGNEVRVAGVKVGEVTDISLEGATVNVEFRTDDVELGDQTGAAVKVKTLLGQKFLSLDPVGREPLDGPIPVARTTTPYDVNEAFSALSDNIEQIDTDQLEEGIDSIAAAFEDTPESVREVVDGLTDLSRTISSRDDELAGLLDASSDVTRTLADRNEEISGIINQGSSLLGELERRRDTVKALLQGTARLGTQLKGLVRDNEDTLRPALERLDEVSAILQRNQDNLDQALAKLGPYYRGVTSALGNGQWIDAYICGLFDENQRPQLDNDIARDCDPDGGPR